MTDRLLLVDFDRTLFDTSRFAETWWRWAAERYAIDIARELGRMEEYFNYVGQWRSYDFYRHIGELDLEVPVEQMLEQARHDLAGENFTYADARAVFKLKDERRIELVTFGNQRYQAYKISFVSMLDDWVKHITEVDKADYLRAKFGERPLVLVDDKDLHRELAENVEFIRLNRAQDHPVEQADGWVSINSLDRLEEVL
ncbi:MAG TPA: hypothetical protein VFL81_01975 [Candidatus Saccharimonadales bacterium]|nr:hypothetical protein [Candidatus Saccharimonadales bacterium]